jgi:hypothetical protein
MPPEYIDRSQIQSTACKSNALFEFLPDHSLPKKCARILLKQDVSCSQNDTCLEGLELWLKSPQSDKNEAMHV